MAEPEDNTKKRKASPNQSEWPSKLKLPRFSAPAEMVTFYIGKDDAAERFTVHKEVACYHSPVLKAAFNSGFVEGQTQIYRFEDVSKDVFRLLVQWLYYQTFDFHADTVTDTAEKDESKGEDCSDNDEGQAFNENTMKLCQLWILADRLNIPSLQNFSMDELDQYCSEECWVPTKSLHHIYENTTAGSLLREWFIQQGACTLTADNYCDDYMEEYPKEFLIDVSYRMCTIIREQISFLKTQHVSKFHVAEKDDESQD